MTGRGLRQRRLAHHPRRRLIRGPGYWSRLGPGIVTGAADDDPSGIGTCSQVGAAFGFGLLWTTLATLPLAIAVQEATARLGLVTGKGLAALLRERFARPVLLGAVTLVAVANTFNIGADIGSMAAAAGLLVPLPHTLAAVAFALVMVVLEIAVPYHRYARVLRWLALSLLAYVGVLVVVHVDWAAALAHTVVPRFHLDRASLAALLAVFGTTISPYLFFWQAGEEVEEQAERHDPVDRDHLAAMRLDVAAGMGSGVGVMFAIMTTVAVTLGAHGAVQVNTAQQAAQALRPLAVAGWGGGQHHGGAHPGAGGQQLEIGLVLHRLLGGGERGLVLDLPERGPAPELVEQVGVALLTADRLDEQPLAVAGAGDEGDGAASVGPGRRRPETAVTAHRLGRDVLGESEADLGAVRNGDRPVRAAVGPHHAQSTAAPRW